MGCSQSTSLKTVMETRPLEPDIAEPLTERPSKPRQNSAVKQDDNLEVSNIRSPSDQGEESKKFSPLKHENSDGGMVSASPDIRQNQTLKQANKSGFLNMSCTKVPSKLRNAGTNLLEKLSVKPSNHLENGVISPLHVRSGSVKIEKPSHLMEYERKNSNFGPERSRPMRSGYNSIFSRQSSREHSIGPQSNIRIDPKGALQGDDKSDSSQEKSPIKPGKQRTGSIFKHMKNKNLLENVEGQNTSTFAPYNRGITAQDNHVNIPEENSVDHEKSVLPLMHPIISSTTHTPSMFPMAKPNQAAGSARNNLKEMMRLRNQTEYPRTGSAKPNFDEDEDENSDIFVTHSKPVKRSEARKPGTNIQTKPKGDEYKIKYGDLNVKIGSGSYATVEKWRKRESGEHYVMKLMTISHVTARITTSYSGINKKEVREIAKQLCDNEIEVSNALGCHPNISTIEDCYIDKAGEEYRFFSKFADNGTLFSDRHIEFLKIKAEEKSSEISIDTIKTLFKEIVEGVKHSKQRMTLVHSKGIVHRDIKFENILIFEDGTAKLTDFSVSLCVNKCDSCLLKLGTTKICQSPELLLNPNYLGYSHDIWSLGVVLWQMIFKKTPFNVDDGEAIFKEAVLSFTPVFPEGCQDQHLMTLLSEMLRQDPSQRWDIEQVAKSSWLV